MKNVDVIILSWAKDDVLKSVTKKCINSLLLSEKKINFNVFLLESNPNVKYDFSENVKVIYMKDTFGYHKYMNIGRKMGNSEYVVLCNNDLRFGKSWASYIINQMEKDEELLSACPFEPTVNLNKKYSSYYGYDTRKHVNGWCIFQKRKIYDIIGDLDETFEFWCCDDDYGMQLKNNNIKHMLVRSSIVHHDDNGGKSLTKLEMGKKREYTAGGIQKFVKKYGHPPLYLAKNNRN